MTTYSTQNPVGSTDPRDLYDNAENLDNFVNGDQAAYNDRLGKLRKSWQGMEDEFAAFIASSGYEFVGDYAAGIEITGYQQILRDTSGEFWRVSGSTALPYTTTGSGLPEGGAFVAVGDAVLRQELASNTAGQGSDLVAHTGTPDTVTEALDKRAIFVGSVAELDLLTGLKDGQRVAVTDNSADYYWDAGTSSFVEVSQNTGLINKHAWAGAVQNERDYATLDAAITPDIADWSRTNFDESGNHAAGTIGTLTTACTGEAFSHYLLKATINTTASGRIKILQGGVDIIGDQPDGYFFSTAAVLEDATENNRAVTANEFYFLVMTSGSGFSDFSFETDTAWAGSITFAAVYPVNATRFSVAGYSELAAGNENPVGIKTTGYNRGDVVLGDKYTLGVFQYDGVLPTPAYNTAIGSRALGSNFKGDENTALGAFALQYNEGSNNVGVGYSALKLNTKGQENTSIGYKSGITLSTGYRNVFAGFWAGSGVRTGQANVEIGWKPNNEPGDRSFTTVVGYYAGLLQGEGSQSNVTVGASANRSGAPRSLGKVVSIGAESHTYQGNSVSVGYQATSGADAGAAGGSVAIGAYSVANAPLQSSTSIGYEAQASGDRSVAVGQSSKASGEQSAALGGLAEANGQYTTALGSQAGRNNTGTGNTYVGRAAGNLANNSFSNTTCLGQVSAVTASNQVQLGNSATTVYAYGPVQDRSDKRDKTDIKPLTDEQIAFFMDIEWRQFRMDYREDYDWGEKDGSKTRTRFHIGAIAQQVEDAMHRHGVDFAGLQHHSISGGMDVYSIGYQEFIGIQGEIIQRQQKQLSKIEERLSAAGI
jgi:hypothetical protein